MNRLYEYFVALGDLFMPRACLACGRRLGMRERHLCLSCAADVPYTRSWLAAHNPLADSFNAVLERHRGTEPMDYAYAAALIYYKGAYRSIPRALKYQGDLAAGRHYGALLGRRLAAAPHFADIDLVIPVPLHWTRLRSRGYNQAEVLARALVDAFRAAAAPGASAAPPSSVSERCPVVAGHDEGVTPTASSGAPSTVIPGAPSTVIPGAPSTVIPGAPSTVIPGLTRNLPEVRTDLLVRARRTRTQTRVSVDQKARNVASAFQVPERFPLRARIVSTLKGDAPESPASVLASARHILLVDDTFTTGATLYACYAALRPFTTARISIATLAAVEGTPSGGP
jgi:predicted amidophosphoribosyltransferase